MGATGKWVTVGIIGRPHGVKGAVHVNTSLSDPADLCAYSPLSLVDGRALEVANVRSGKEGRVIATFTGITTRDAASALTHQALRIPRERLPKINGNDFYYADLIGLSALKDSGEKLGEVIAVHNFGAGDVIEIKTGSDTLMVAFSKDFVPKVDLKAGALTIADAALAGD